MDMENKSPYEAPSVKFTEIIVEQGFALSSPLKSIPENEEEYW